MLVPVSPTHYLRATTMGSRHSIYTRPLTRRNSFRFFCFYHLCFSGFGFPAKMPPPPGSIAGLNLTVRSEHKVCEHIALVVAQNLLWVQPGCGSALGWIQSAFGTRKPQCSTNRSSPLHFGMCWHVQTKHNAVRNWTSSHECETLKVEVTPNGAQKVLKCHWA